MVVFSLIFMAYNVYIYGEEIILKFRWENGPPLYALTKVRGTLCS